MTNEFTLSFPAIRAVQARREYYVIMCPLKHISKIFTFDDVELSPEIRAQRILNKSRVPNLARYIVDNPDDYVFSAITASIDGDVVFDKLGKPEEETTFGLLKIGLGAKFIINDGQHRRAAIEQAVHLEPKLGNDSIAVVLFLDKGLERSQQMFSDLNRHAIRPATSIARLYDHRDPIAEVIRRVVYETEVFKGVVEMERSNIAERSSKLFPFSGIYSASKYLINLEDKKKIEQVVILVSSFWENVGQQFDQWRGVRIGNLSAAEVRRDYIHTHVVMLQALGIAGKDLIKANPTNWKAKLKNLKKIDWLKSNPIWDRRVLNNGRVVKNSNSIVLASNVIKKSLGVTLNVNEKALESKFKKNGK